MAVEHLGRDAAKIANKTGENNNQEARKAGLHKGEKRWKVAVERLGGDAAAPRQARRPSCRIILL